MFYVYLLKSKNHNQVYIGFSKDLKKRLAAHNAGQSPHTSKYKPWLLESYFSFKEEGVARAFEKYLKTGSGKAFINRHIMPK
ncbi:MAG TPA: GIY-YIG nuclease family protein [Candidatus Saccharibacteria bacterium]|jgi:putative endonuclease|nr:putative endonuclease [Patescibacteria group bacterium]HMS31230.1 GIY-YIG nuclease family protein [Candidatus Saccharibacteria bacterium]